jgi:hypothetical protein
MTQLLKLTSKIILVSVCSAYLMSCTGGSASSSFGSSSSGSLVDKIPDGMSNGIVDPSFLYVGVESKTNDVAHVHKDGMFGTNCAIDPNSSLQDIKCIVDVPEAELYMHGLELKYNVPAGMCRYLARETYWFWNHEIGFGPSSIVVNVTVTDGSVTASSCQFDGGGVVPCNSSIEALVNTSSPAPVIKCIYDHSSLEGGRNGCLGTYSLTVNTTTITSGTPPTTSNSTSTSTVQWGGTVGPLVGGAGRNGWQIGPEGLPLRIYTASHLGLLNQTYKINPPIDTSGVGYFVGAPRLTALEIANYYTPALNIHDGYTTGATSDQPYALQPIDDFSGSPIVGGNDSYLFECIDQAHEVLHRIKVYVRDWDTYQDYYDYITSKGTTEVPDRRVGSEGGTCTGIYGPCNDYPDFDDLAVGWVSYNTTVPLNNSTDVNLGRRQYYFPQIRSK